jgi:hypothetical protein
MALDGKLTGIIDWSSSRASFAEEDFCPMKHQGWAEFAGYSNIRPVPKYAQIIPLLRLAKALAMGFTIRTNTWQTRNADFYEMNRKFIEKMFCSL